MVIICENLRYVNAHVHAVIDMVVFFAYSLLLRVHAMAISSEHASLLVRIHVW